MNPSQVAIRGLHCLESYDSGCIGELLWEREVEKTGLSPQAVKVVLDGPYRLATKGFKREGDPELHQMDINQVSIEAAYRSPDGRRHGLGLVAQGGASGARLTPLSMELFSILGNLEQRPMENHYTAWRRMLSKNRPLFESVGWRGIFGSSAFGDYRNWDSLDKHLAEMERREDQMMAKRKVKL
jgi:hypothetical protein